tara:strand:- start:229 stop:378 length:150 start_codon:yes stop_codon:yes gene_type:complete
MNRELIVNIKLTQKADLEYKLEDEIKSFLEFDMNVEVNSISVEVNQENN